MIEMFQIRPASKRFYLIQGNLILSILVTISGCLRLLLWVHCCCNSSLFALKLNDNFTNHPGCLWLHLHIFLLNGADCFCVIRSLFLKNSCFSFALQNSRTQILPATSLNKLKFAFPKSFNLLLSFLASITL